MMQREELIREIELARVKGVVIPTNLFGKKVFVKTTKHDLVTQIRHEFGEQDKVGLEMRVEKDIAIVESTRSRGSGDLPYSLTEGTIAPPKRPRGRPKGSKNRVASATAH